jgi:hypothetical protein
VKIPNGVSEQQMAQDSETDDNEHETNHEHEYIVQGSLRSFQPTIKAKPVTTAEQY